MGVSDSYARGRELLRGDPVKLAVGIVLVLMFLDLVRQLLVGSTQFYELGVLLKNGLMRGLVIGLAGIGLSMTYSILNFANFAHGDYITSGAFAGFATAYVIAGFGRADIGSLVLVGAGGSVFGGTLGIGVAGTPVAILLGLVVAAISTIALALFIDRTVYKPLRDRGGITLLITSVGVAFALRYIVLFVFGGTKRGVTQSAPNTLIPFVDGVVPADLHDLSLLVVSVGLMLGVHFLLQKTKLGKAMRAMADNEDLARVTGIPTERIVTYTWIIGAGLTGIAGFMFVLWKGTLGYFDGWLLLLPIFAAVILGGIGSIYGAILGGLVIGFTWSVSVVWLPSGLARAAAFFVMIVVLLIRPQGIFAGRSTA